MDTLVPSNLVAPNDAIVGIRRRRLPAHDDGTIPRCSLAHGDTLGCRAWHCWDSNTEPLGPPRSSSHLPPLQPTLFGDPEVPAVAVQALGPTGIGSDFELILVAPLECRDDGAELPAHILLGPGSAGREQAAIQHHVTLWSWPWCQHLDGTRRVMGT